MNLHHTPNKLIAESSPYLLQHAYNPVQWYPWGEEALEKSKLENKPILVSIGYSACHWCHVMERECFEKPEIAEIMNAHFINIKVDREERPDVDHLYMDAVQMMSIRGGWPLNVFLMPDTKPFYGGTYFPPQQWASVLSQIANAFENNNADLQKSANGFAESLAGSEVQRYQLQNQEIPFELKDLENAFQKLEQNFDKQLGGTNREPKFPMPSIYHFLLRYHQLTNDIKALQHTKLTLDRMAMGGIYDQIGGGFSRYSVDAEWFAPHFEKMLYDNGQLLSLYSEAYCVTKSNLYKEIVYETIAWLSREMRSEDGAFYSALDADSEGHEGKFYVWKNEELEMLIPLEDQHLFFEYYHVTDGNWENGDNILNRNLTDLAFSNKHQIPLQDFESRVKKWKSILLEARTHRIRPGLDDKILASWNGIALRGITDAFKYFGEPQFLTLAKQNADFINSNLRVGDSIFRNFKNGKATIAGYLEDYAFVIDGFIGLYQICFEEKYLHDALALAEYAVAHFYDNDEELFFFTSNLGEQLIARKKEIFDNVVPASNSAMAKNLYTLAIFFDRNDLMQIAITMMGSMKKLITSDISYLTNWATLYTSLLRPTAEVAIVGNEFETMRAELDSTFYPNKILSATAMVSELPLLKDKDQLPNSTTAIHVCSNHTCQLPVAKASEAIHLMAAIQ